MRFYLVSLTLTCCLTSGCGTMVGGTHQTINISSEPSGAMVSIKPLGVSSTTPTEVTLSKSVDHVAIFQLEGFETKRVRINRSLALSAHLNSMVPFVGAIGLATDSATDGEFRLDPDPIHAILTPIQAEKNVSSKVSESTSRSVVFFNRNEYIGTVYFKIAEGPKCKLKKGQFVTIELPIGPHLMSVYHWDIVKFKNDYELVIDISISHVGIFSAITSTQYSYYDGLPNLKKAFEEVECVVDGAT